MLHPLSLSVPLVRLTCSLAARLGVQQRRGLQTEQSSRCKASATDPFPASAVLKHPPSHSSRMSGTYPITAGVANQAPPTAAAAATAVTTKSAPPKRKRDSALDFFSADFDPAKALRTPGLQPPLPVAPMESWDDAAQLADTAELTCTMDPEDPTANVSLSLSLPSVQRSSASVSVSAPASLFPTGDGSSLLDMLDDAQAEAAEAKHQEDATQAARLATAAGSSAQAAAASAVPPSVGNSSRMSAEQIRLNRAKADARALERQQLKEKSAHFMDRFTTLFPVPKPISTPAMRARAVEGPMALLRTMHQRRVKVFVVIRRSHGLRCILHAYLSAFDKHWNLLLLDVDETFSEWEWRLCGQNTIAQLLHAGTRFQLPSAKKRRHPQIDEQAALRDTGEGAMEDSASSTAAVPAAPAAAAASVARPPSHIRVEALKQRHVHQLYVRGDGVGSVCEFAPTLFMPERMTASDAVVAAAKLLGDWHEARRS